MWQLRAARSLGKFAVESVGAGLPGLLWTASKVKRSKKLPVQLKEPSARLPYRAYPDDAGLDLYTAENVELLPGETRPLSTGIAVELPKGTLGYVTGRSSWAKRGLLVYPGTIDAGYRGIIYVLAANLSGAPLKIEQGNRIAQMLVLPFVTLDPEDRTSVTSEDQGRRQRGAKGLGSSGA